MGKEILTLELLCFIRPNVWNESNPLSLCRKIKLESQYYHWKCQIVQESCTQRCLWCWGCPSCKKLFASFFNHHLSDLFSLRKMWGKCHLLNTVLWSGIDVPIAVSFRYQKWTWRPLEVALMLNLEHHQLLVEVLLQPPVPSGKSLKFKFLKLRTRKCT